MDAGSAPSAAPPGLSFLMGTLWGGCDDASGPVLVRVTAGGIRTWRSPPLGGAILSAASPEEADILKHRGGGWGGGVGGTEVIILQLPEDAAHSLRRYRAAASA